MARTARIKATGQSAWYHVHARAAEYRGVHPLLREGAQQELLRLIRRFSEAYFCGIPSYCLMGNHYHMVVRFEEPGEVEHGELRRRALLLYPEKRVKRWKEENWERLRRRLFDLSELMRNVQGEFGEWFNERFERQGHFWAERFQSHVLADGQAVQDAMIYVELNPVRARLVERPEQWEYSSAHSRSLGEGGWLMPLEEALPWTEADSVQSDYRARLYLRGAVAPEEGQGVIPAEIVEDEAARGFPAQGAYLKRLAHFTRGLVLGGREAVVEWIAVLQIKKRLRQGRQPVDQSRHGAGKIFSLRAPRSRDGPAG